MADPLMNRCELHVRFGSILLNKSGSSDLDRGLDHCKRCGPACTLLLGWLDVRHRYQFRQLPEVLGGGCQEELIAGTVWSP
jgi:hypothetical protein